MARRLGFNISLDTKEVSKYFDGLTRGPKLDKAVRRGLAKVGIETRRKVIPKTPRGKGGLVNSWKVESSKLTAEMGFNIIYAMYQHQGRREDGSYIIVNRPAGGETYFLKNALDENYKRILQIFAQEIKSHLIETL